MCILWLDLFLLLLLFVCIVKYLCLNSHTSILTPAPFKYISAFTLSIMVKYSALWVMDGPLIILRKWSVELWTLLALSGCHFGYIAKMEGPISLWKWWQRKVLELRWLITINQIKSNQILFEYVSTQRLHWNWDNTTLLKIVPCASTWVLIGVSVMSPSFSWSVAAKMKNWHLSPRDWLFILNGLKCCVSYFLLGCCCCVGVSCTLASRRGLNCLLDLGM